MSPQPAPECVKAPPATRSGPQISGLGVALPPRVVDNAEATALLEVGPEWVLRRTGIRERRWADPGMTLVDLSAWAATAALTDAGVDAASIDLVLVATCTADELLPSVSPLVAAAIGATNAGAIDVGAACTGFVSALVLGAAMVESGRSDRVLVVGAELLSRHTDRADRQTAALFGDGAGAIVLARGGMANVGPVSLGSDGDRGELIRMDRTDQLIRMEGQEVFQEAIRRMAQATEETLSEAGLEFSEVDLFVFHQANARILQALTERLELDRDRVVNAITGAGNTSAASIPLALSVAREDGRLRPGARVLVTAFGAGLTWASTVITWGRDA